MHRVRSDFCTQISKKELKNSQCPIENCTRQFAQNAARNVKFLSSLIQIGPFTAENAGRRKDRQEGDIKFLALTVKQSHYSFIFSINLLCFFFSLDLYSLRQNLNIEEVF